MIKLVIGTNDEVGEFNEDGNDDEEDEGLLTQEHFIFNEVPKLKPQQHSSVRASVSDTLSSYF